MNVFREICTGLREGRAPSLATIVRATGPVPAPLQSKLVVLRKPDVEVRGTVGGGCLDTQVISLLRCVELNEGEDTAAGPGSPARRKPSGTITRPLPASGSPLIRKFSLDDELGDTAMTCGGSVEVMLEHLVPEMLPEFEIVESRFREGVDSILVTPIGGEQQYRKFVLDTDGSMLSILERGEAGPPNLDSAAMPGPEETIRRIRREGEDYLLEYIEAPPRLVILGGGHVGKAVADVAARSGFHVTVVDDRPEFAGPDRFPGETVVVCGRFDQVWEELTVSDRTYIVIATRGHKNDELVLGKCLTRNPRYLGMIGSRRKVSLTYKNLERGGASPERLRTVHAPIGLKIGAVTPEEIGVAIVAEMIAVRRSRRTG